MPGLAASFLNLAKSSSLAAFTNESDTGAQLTRWISVKMARIIRLSKFIWKTKN